MKAPKLNVKRYNHSDTLKWVVGWRDNGKRKRTFFETETKAKTWAEQKRNEFANDGIKALNMSDELRTMATSGAERLRPFEKTLQDAVTHYVQHLEAVKRSCTLNELVEKFIQPKEKARRSHVHLVTLRSRLGRFCRTSGSGSRLPSTAEIDDWLGDLEMAGETRNNIRKRSSVCSTSP